MDRLIVPSATSAAPTFTLAEMKYVIVSCKNNRLRFTQMSVVFERTYILQSLSKRSCGNCCSQLRALLYLHSEALLYVFFISFLCPFKRTAFHECTLGSHLLIRCLVWFPVIQLRCVADSFPSNFHSNSPTMATAISQIRLQEAVKQLSPEASLHGSTVRVNHCHTFANNEILTENRVEQRVAVFKSQRM